MTSLMSPTCSASAFAAKPAMSASILIVDDEPDVADLFRQRFRREVALISELALELTDQLPGGVEILFHIPEFGCGRCLGSHLDHCRGQRGRRLFSADTDETFRE
jgi:hypothetical protein